MKSASSRTSHEVRGLKLKAGKTPKEAVESHLTRGAWIEIIKADEDGTYKFSRTSHEVRGLKLLHISLNSLHSVVAPHTRCVD